MRLPCLGSRVAIIDSIQKRFANLPQIIAKVTLLGEKGNYFNLVTFRAFERDQLQVNLFLFQRLDPAEQLQHIGNLRKAIQYAAQDVHGGKMPGFCIVGKVVVYLV